MATMAGAPAHPSDTGNGADFEHWLIARSLAMLPPLCRLGLLVTSLMLLVIDPMLFAYGIWGDNPQHHALLAWHSAAGLYFAAFLGAAQRLVTHRGRKRCLAAFMALGAALFTWFGFVSWV